jgi:hypothetical protein
MSKFTAYGQTLDLDTLGLAKSVVKAIMENKVLSYCIGNGWTQSIGDAGALSKSEEIPPTMTKPELIAARRADKAERIRKGEVGQGSARGPRAVGFEKFLHDASVIRLKASYSAAKKVFPSGKGSAEKIRAAVEEYWSKERKSHAEVRAAAQAAFEASKVTAENEDDLEDILDDLTEETESEESEAQESEAAE